MITFHSPLWLLLVPVLAPFVIGYSLRSLAGLGRVRQSFAILLRVLVISLVALALAEPQYVRANNRVSTVFVLDRSDSIPRSEADRALDAVSSAVGRRTGTADSAGLVLFAKDARLELPIASYPAGYEIRSLRSQVDRSASDLSAGLRLALASLPSDGLGRIVLVSDGNQNRGNVLAEALAARQSGIPIDVIAIDYRRKAEVLVEKLALPERLKVGDRVRLRVVLRSLQDAAGVLRIDRVAAASRETILQQPVLVHDGVNVLSVEAPLTDPDLYRLEAEFIPDDDRDDFFAENNRAGAYTIIEGVGRVLLVEDSPGRQKVLTDILRKAGLAVVPTDPESLAKDLGFFRAFDSIVLADVPAARFDEDRQKLIAASTKELGSGLIMVGGPKSFGPGGYDLTPIEEALPVDCKVKSTIVQASLAIVFVIDRSGSMMGDKLALAIQGAKAAVDLMEPSAEAGVIAFDSETTWIRKLLPIRNAEQVKHRIDSIGSAGGTDMGPALVAALDALIPSKSMTKHVIVLSDGMSAPADWNAILSRYRKEKITMSTVAVGNDCDIDLMRRLAVTTSGRFHHAIHPRTVPQIYIRETRTVSRPLIYEREQPWSPRVEYPTEPIQGMPKTLPAISGFVLTTPKSTAEVAAVSPNPAEIPVNPILAHWQYGLGRSAAFTTDSGERWAVGWPNTELFGKFWSQLVRWTLRPNESRELTTAIQERDGRVTVVVNAVGPDRDFLNFLDLKGTLLKPDSTSAKLDFRQREPGKYVAEFDADASGSYLANVTARLPDGRPALSTAGLTLSYSPEYRNISSNRDLLDNIAMLTGGKVVTLDSASSVDFYRRDRPSRVRLDDNWPIFLLACLVAFLADVAVRRIAIQPSAIRAFFAKSWARLRRRPIPAEAATTIERLRGRKQQVDASLTQRREFVAPTSSSTAPSVLPEPDHSPAPTSTDVSPAPPSAQSMPSEQETGHMSRLLKAKRKVWEDRDDSK